MHERSFHVNWSKHIGNCNPVSQIIHTEMSFHVDSSKPNFLKISCCFVKFGCYIKLLLYVFNGTEQPTCQSSIKFKLLLLFTCYGNFKIGCVMYLWLERKYVWQKIHVLIPIWVWWASSPLRHFFFQVQPELIPFFPQIAFCKTAFAVSSQLLVMSPTSVSLSKLPYW